MFQRKDSHVLSGLSLIISHGLITTLAIGIAFTLPVVAQFILYQWWPRVESDSNLLLTTEIGLASVLVLLFNFVKVSWSNRRYVVSAKLASLAYARSNGNWLSRWQERALFKRLPVTRDACVLTVTGFDTFVHKSSRFGSALETAYEIRVMLLNPAGHGARVRVDSLPPGKSNLAAFCEEIESSISYLRALRKSGKKVTLKFYEQQPFWKVVVLGEHVWVQYCHSGWEMKQTPEYVFTLHHREPTRGLFVPFYVYFLEKWEDQSHAEFDFDTRELVYRDSMGQEVERLPFPNPATQHFNAVGEHVTAAEGCVEGDHEWRKGGGALLE
ncbi:MAG TPA: hypothetical protein VGR01_08345 [Burkholderiales bacterium]|jgi:hypothetical protein|nr:hypothetical protein [Burkholderiales bacterium]